MPVSEPAVGQGQSPGRGGRAKGARRGNGERGETEEAGMRRTRPGFFEPWRACRDWGEADARETNKISFTF